LTLVDCACQNMDASWESDRGPLITQANSISILLNLKLNSL
jgi:hypothetical protein